MTTHPPPERGHFRFVERSRVRWAEVDLQGIVFNGHYLMYFDTAVAGYWRALAMPYHDTMQALQGDFYVRKATLEYEASARYDEQLEVGVRCAGIGKSSMRQVLRRWHVGAGSVGDQSFGRLRNETPSCSLRVHLADY